MASRYVLSYDLGTSGVKCALVTMDGALVCSATAQYTYEIPRLGWAEQAPQAYWDGVCHVTKEVLRQSNVQATSVAGIVFGTLWKGIILIDQEGNVLRPSILWMDGRAQKQAERLKEAMSGKAFGPTDYWPKLLWLRDNEPENLDRAVMILEVNSYLKWKATGKAAVDISNSFVRAFDEEQEQYYEALSRFVGIPREKFPPLVEATDLVGHITQQAADEMGLVQGIPVFGGNNDIQGVTVGAGCARTGGVHVYFGSSGWMGFTVPHGEGFISSSLDRKHDIGTAGMKSVGLTINWVAKTLYRPEYAQSDADAFSLMDREIAQVKAGCDGLLAAPWIYGEYPPLADLDAGGCFLNLRPDHSRGTMARAMMEGLCFHLKQRAQYMCRIKDCPWPGAVRAVGGGTCSDVWMQILADVLQIPVHVPESPRHCGAVGTAYSAIIGLGYCTDYEEAAQKVKLWKVFKPDPQNVAIYEKRYALYTQLYGALKPVFSTLNEER